MRFFLVILLFIITVCGILWYVDAPGSGMAYPTILFSLILVGVLVYNKVARGSWLADGANLNKRP